MNPRRLLKFGAPSLAALAALAAAPFACLAQGSQENTYEIVTATVKPGMTAKYEQGVKKVIAYARSQAVPDAILGFVVMDGPGAGRFTFLRPVRWADQDHPPSYAAGMQREIEKDIAPYSTAEIGLSDQLPEFGRPAPAGSPPMKYYEVEQYTLKPDRMSDFMVALGELAHAEEQKNPGSRPYYVYVERSGGNANQVVVVVGYPTFADLARTGKSPFQTLVEQYGPGSTSIWRSALGAISSEQNWILMYRPDLSYIPSGQGK